MGAKACLEPRFLYEMFSNLPSPDKETGVLTAP